MIALKCYTFVKEQKIMYKKKVGVVCGGYSSEHEISLQSGETVFSTLDRNLWEVFLIVLNKDSWTAKDDNEKTYSVSKGEFTLINSNTTVKLDLVFNLVHGAMGENGQLAALWELLKIPFTSCNSYNAALTFNKRDCLTVLKASGIPTAKSYALDKGDPIDTNVIVASVGLPCFVKANRAGSSFGVFKVYHPDDLIESIKKAFEEDTQLIIESFLDGREVSVGVATLENAIHVLPITEIISENDFFDYGAKYWENLKKLLQQIFQKIGKSRFKNYQKKYILNWG